MKLLACSLLAFLLSIPPAQDLAAQEKKPIPSPRDSVFLSLDTNRISVNYGRPSIRGRKIMGGLVPWNQVWRTGANEATHLKTNFDMTFGGVPVTKGTYTLWTLPSPTGWKVIINKQTGQWGTRYDERQDLARFDAKSETLPAPVDTFTIGLQKTGPESGVMTLSWETTRVTVPFQKNLHIRPLSPPDSAGVTIAGKPVIVRYSAPYMRGRTIWGVVVPWDSVWRTGANAPTTLTTTQPVSIGSTDIPAGTYVLRTIPAKDNATLIVSRPAQGNGPIPDSLVVARVPMKMETSSKQVDPFKIGFTQVNNTSAELRMGWADRIYSVVVAVR